MTRMVTVRVRRTIAAPRERVFALALDPDRFPALFPGLGPIPAVRRVERLDAGPLRVGSERSVRSADGSVLLERVTVLDDGQRHAYRVSGFRPPLSWWIVEGEGDWRFERDGETCTVLWSYRFRGRNRLAAVPVALLAHTFFRLAMRRCLVRLAQEA